MGNPPLRLSEVLNDLVPTYFLLKYIMRSLLARLPPLHSKKLTDREIVNFQKWDFFRFFFTLLL